ncbi:MAG TPA: Ig-like domain-containing protein [Candidatus Paceibacterota bacterium]|nr:Ig-like domain-containing protein [Candidatus Paceibacterota bacterium]
MRNRPTLAIILGLFAAGAVVAALTAAVLTAGAPRARAAGSLTSNLAPGSTDDASVATLQDFLAAHGFAPAGGFVSGAYDAATMQAVGGYQCANGIVCPGGLGYGWVGPRTRASINAQLAAAPAGGGTSSASTSSLLALIQSLEAQLLALEAKLAALQAGSGSGTGQGTPPPGPGTPFAYVTATLRPGSSDTTNVARIQTFLVHEGYLPNTYPTGAYDAATQAAVARYQCARGIVCSGAPLTNGYGAVGPRTLAAMNADIAILDAPAPSGPTPTPIPTPTPSGTPTPSTGGGGGGSGGGSTGGGGGGNSGGGSGGGGGTPADTIPPIISVTAPAQGASLSGVVSLAAAASDNVGVTQVQWVLDGANLGSAVAVPPYAFSWNTTGAANGSHALQAVAFDAAGNRATSRTVAVTVGNAGSGPTPTPTPTPTPNPTPGGISFVQGNASWGVFGSTYQCSLNQPVHAGDLIIAVFQESSYNNVPAVSDSLGSAFTKKQVWNGTSPALGNVTVWYAVAGAGSSDVIQVQPDNSPRGALICAEYAGLSQLEPFDAASTSPNPASKITALASPAVVTVGPGELILGFGGNASKSSGTFTPGTGFTMRLSTSSSLYDRGFFEDMVAGSAGSYAATAVSGFADYWNMSVAAFTSVNQSCEKQGSCYVVSGGTGTRRGLDWNNAYADFPQALTCGVTYYVAGGTFDYTTGGHTWNTNCTPDKPVRIYKAVAGGPGSPERVAGWQGSYGTNQAVFTQTANADPQKPAANFFMICGSNYLIDGVTPAVTPSTNGPYGIVLRTINHTTFVDVGYSSGCGGGAITNVTLKHIEYDGVSSQYGEVVVAGHRAAGVVTLTLAGAPAWVAGDRIDLYSASTTDFNTGSSGYGVTLTSVNGTTVSYAQAGSDETLVTTPQTYVTLNGGGNGPIGIYGSAYGASSLANSIYVDDSYMHDFTGGINVIGCIDCHFDRNYFAKTRSTATNHQNGYNANEATSQTYFVDDIWEDITGTAVINSTGAQTSDIVMDHLYVVNNVFFCSQAALASPNPAIGPRCGVSADIGDDNGANDTTNGFFYGNTFADMNSLHDGIVLVSPRSFGTVENNLFYFPNGGSTSRYVFMPAGAGSFEDYNTVIGRIHSGTALAGPHDSYQPSSTADPFVSDAAKDFRLTSDTLLPHLNDGVPLAAPFDTDLRGSVRSPSAWDRGAYQYP